jgi:hypothetical protein
MDVNRLINDIVRDYAHISGEGIARGTSGHALGAY